MGASSGRGAVWGNGSGWVEARPDSVPTNDPMKLVQQALASLVAQFLLGRGLIERNHRVEVEQPHDGLSRGKLRDDVAKLNRGPGQTRRRTTGASEVGTRLPRAWGREATTSPDETRSSRLGKPLL